MLICVTRQTVYNESVNFFYSLMMKCKQNIFPLSFDLIINPNISMMDEFCSINV